MTRLTWYVQRMRSMSAAELAWRASRAATGVADRVAPRAEPSDASLTGASDTDWHLLLEQFRDGTGRPVLLDRARAQAVGQQWPEEAAAVIAAADKALASRFTFFGYPEASLGDPIDWHRDPLSGTRWPAVPADRIDHRSHHGDPKWIWELNRLQHLPWLAQAWLLTGDDGYADGALHHLDSWLAHNPPGIGIAWRGAFEAGVRAISVALALQGLRDSTALTPQRYRAAVRMLAASARRCWRDRSRFSSANNHLVGELAGLATVAILFPELAAARQWEQRAVRLLTTEADRQILPDGAGAEQAVGYQVFTAELLLVVAALLRLRGDEPPPAITGALDRSASFLATLVGEHDPAPRYGDDDEGFALRLGVEPLRSVRGHLGAVAALTANPAAHRYGHDDITAGWIAAAGQRKPDAGLTPPEAASCYAPHGGIVLLRAGRRRLTMDVGPLGYLSIAAHGHADALSLTLSLDGRELIGDPGAASYYGHPDWRTAHRGTQMHATLTVDGADQSVMAGPFLWRDHASVTTRSVNLERGVVDAEHDGYQRLSGAVTHRRWLLAPPGEDTVLVIDLLDGEGSHRADACWPLHPSLDATRAGKGHVAHRDATPALQLAYAASAPATPHEVRGGELGWWSSRLESREPAWLVGIRCEAPLPLALATLLRPLDAGRETAEHLQVSLLPRSIEICWTEQVWRRHVTVDTSRAGDVRPSRQLREGCTDK